MTACSVSSFAMKRTPITTKNNGNNWHSFTFLSVNEIICIIHTAANFYGLSNLIEK
jgi:hypothetical protein